MMSIKAAVADPLPHPLSWIEADFGRVNVDIGREFVVQLGRECDSLLGDGVYSFSEHYQTVEISVRVLVQ